MEAKVTLEKISGDEAEWYRQSAYFVAMMDRNTMIYNAEERGIEQGIEQGAANKTVEIATKMLAKGVSVEEIAEITGLSDVEIENLRK